MGVTTDARVLLPQFSNDSSSDTPMFVLYDPLVRLDPKTAEVIPWLAERMETAPDGKSYTFYLYKNVKFHDGKPMTAEDVKFTLDSLVDPKVNVPASSRRNWESLQSVDVVDPYTVRLNLKEVNASFLSTLRRVGILPKHLLENEDLNTTKFGDNPVGTGPYKWKERRTGDRIVLTAYDDYFKGRPNIDTWVMRVVKDPAALLAALKTGEVDVGAIEADNLAEAQASSNLKIYEYEPWTYQAFTVHIRNPWFADVKMRQAIYYALDRQKMVDTVHEGKGYVADSPLPRASWAYTPNIETKYNYDPAKAKQILAEIGWTPGPDGVLQRNGERLKFTMLINASSRGLVEQIIQQNLRDIGMDVDIQTMEWGALLQRTSVQPNFEATFFGLGVPPDPDNPNWRCTTWWGYCNPEVDKLLDEARGTVDVAKRKELYAKFQNMFMQDAPRFLLYVATAFRAANERFVLGEASPVDWTPNSWTMWPHEWYSKTGR